VRCPKSLWYCPRMQVGPLGAIKELVQESTQNEMDEKFTICMFGMCLCLFIVQNLNVLILNFERSMLPTKNGCSLVNLECVETLCYFVHWNLLFCQQKNQWKLEQSKLGLIYSTVQVQEILKLSSLIG